MRTPVRAALLAATVLAATVAARWINPLTAIGDIKSDEATYVSMALSVARDGDLNFKKADLDRFVAIYPRGPEGIFLKREYDVRPVFSAGWPPLRWASTPVPTTDRLGYGKAFVYPLTAAPFVALGGVGGLLVFNALLLGICVACAVRFCQARMTPVGGAILGVAFVGASVLPIYGIWLMPEVFNTTLVFTAYFLWLYKEVAPATAWRGWRQPATDSDGGRAPRRCDVLEAEPPAARRPAGARGAGGAPLAPRGRHHPRRRGGDGLALRCERLGDGRGQLPGCGGR